MTDLNTTGDGPLTAVDLTATIADDPFGHGPCRVTQPPCQKPAVLEGGFCADHVAALFASKPALGPSTQPRTRKTNVGQRRAARRKVANASRARNRR